MRVTSLSQVRWFLLLSELLWRLALFWQAHRRVPHRTSTTVPCLCRRIHSGRSLQKSLWVVEVVEKVGLTTCGRGCFGHRAIVLFLWIVEVFVDRQRSLRCRWGWGMGRQRQNAHVQARGWRWMRVRHHGWHMEMKSILPDNTTPEPIMRVASLKVWHFTSYKLSRFHWGCAEEQCMCKPHWHRKLTRR